MSVEKEIRKILGEATPAAARAKQDLVRSGLGHDKNAAATMAALKDPEAAMQNPAKRELLLKVMQDLLDVVVNDPSMVMKTKSALRKEEIEEALIGGQKKLDKNKNGKLDAEDFKKLRGMKEDDCEMDDDEEDEEDEKKSKNGMKENYVSHAQRKAVWASRNDAKEALKRKTKKEEIEQVDEMNDYKVQVTHKNKDGKEETMIHHLTGVKHRNAAGYIAIDRHRNMLKKKGIEPHAFSARIVESVTTNYDMIKGQSKNKAPTQKLATDYKLATKKTQKEETQANEAYNDYFARRKREEDIISGKRPARKKAPAQTSDYQNRRNKEKANEEIQIDEMMSPAETYKKLAVKHLRDSMDKNATQKQRDYAKMMNKRALEASKMDNHTDALNHYRGMAKEEVQIDEAFPTVADARKRAKEAMKSKFEKKKISTGTVYQKKHKDKEKEEKDEKGEMDEAVKADKNVPFDPPYSNKQIAIPGKQGIGVSSARHLARLALAKQLKNKNNK